MSKKRKTAEPKAKPKRKKAKPLIPSLIRHPRSGEKIYYGDLPPRHRNKQGR